MEYVLLIVGFALLIKGADFFVDGASDIAKRLHVPAIVIGLTIVAFGTSMPEAAVSITAAMEGNNGIAVGNIVGSNLFNLLIVAGIAALFRTLQVDKTIIVRDFPLSIVGAVMLLLLFFDGIFNKSAALNLTRADGGILLVFFAFFLAVTLKSALKARNEAKVVKVKAAEIVKPKPAFISILMLLFGIAGIIFGGDLTVDAASKIAKAFGMSDALIGLTIVAIGTSLPEFVTSVVAAKKGESDLAIGNVIGSNIFNIFFILGASAVIYPLEVPRIIVNDIIILIISSVLVYLAVIKSRQLKRPLGMGMSAAYLLYMVYIIIR